MSSFPSINSKKELSTLVETSYEGIQKGKWLTQDVKLINKASRFRRIVKIFFSVFGDRFKTIRTHNTAKGLASLCTQHKDWVDQPVAQKACAILDLLKEKTKESRKKALYAEEIENAKKQIRGLIVDTTSTQNPPDTIPQDPQTSSKEQVVLSKDSQDFTSLSEAKKIVIDLKLTPEQQNEVKKATEKSISIKEVFSPAAAKENEDLVRIMQINPKVKLSVDEHLDTDSKKFSIEKKRAKGSTENKIDNVLSQLETKIDHIEVLDLGAEITPAQEKRLADLIFRAPKLKEFKISALETCQGDFLLDALIQKKTLTSVSCFGEDKWITSLSQNLPRIQSLSLIASPELSEEAIKSLENFSELEKFEMTDPANCVEKLPVFAETLIKMKKIKNLSLHRDRHFLKVYAARVENNSKLPNIDLNMCEQIHDAFKEFAEKKCTIDEVNIKAYSDNMDGPISKTLPFLTQLSIKKLHLHHARLTYEDYKKLEEMTSAEELYIRYPSDGGELKTIEKLLKNLPNLKKIFFYPSIDNVIRTDKVITQGHSLPPHELKKLQELFPKINIQSRRAINLTV